MQIYRTDKTKDAQIDLLKHDRNRDSKIIDNLKSEVAKLTLVLKERTSLQGERATYLSIIQHLLDSGGY